VKNSEAIAASDCFVKRGEFVTRSIAGEMILVPIRTQVADLDSIYNLSAVGMLIWNLLDGHTTVDQIAQAVCAEFDATEEQAQIDSLEFLAALEAAGIAGPSEQRDHA
jgi:hypothetical protein